MQTGDYVVERLDDELGVIRSLDVACRNLDHFLREMESAIILISLKRIPHEIKYYAPCISKLSIKACVTNPTAVGRFLVAGRFTGLLLNFRHRTGAVQN
jgi:hypothetical protein